MATHSGPERCLRVSGTASQLLIIASRYRLEHRARLYDSPSLVVVGLERSTRCSDTKLISSLSLHTHIHTVSAVHRVTTGTFIECISNIFTYSIASCSTNLKDPRCLRGLRSYFKKTIIKHINKARAHTHTQTHTTNQPTCKLRSSVVTCCRENSLYSKISPANFEIDVYR